ncbi:porin [Oceanospirillum sanctuarii]|uniref:porin n=1 Tax=Oceanospirillum sanctuarii TaxID=1434821 RepID=UPI000A3C262E|nr:porin [Oceanospirillum sanctuarii]
MFASSRISGYWINRQLFQNEGLSIRLFVLFTLLIAGVLGAKQSQASAQDLKLGLLVRGQFEDHQGISKAKSLALEEAASLPLARVYLEGEFAPRTDIYVALEADDIRLRLQEAYVGYLISPEQGQRDSNRLRRILLHSSVVNNRSVANPASKIASGVTSGSGLWLHAGRMRESFGLQNQARPQDLTLLAPSVASSAATDADNPEGLRLSYLTDQSTTQFGVFHHRNADVVGDASRPWSGSLRLAVRTQPAAMGQFQFGLSLGLKDIFVGSRWQESAYQLDTGFRDSALISPVSLFNSESNAIDSEQRGALEFVWHRKGFTVQSESFYRQINAVHDGVDESLNGHYVELSWLTKGEPRYFSRDGILQQPNPVGAWGSFEWITGVDALNVNRSDTGKTENYYSWFLGHNWYANPNVKVYSLWRYSQADSVFVSDQEDGFGHGVRLGAQLSI